ncbi:MAG: hypothetical protein HQK51_07765 [Oligoflexia bacterium]|nr:hypothetical protein [Oligoflexia bacterium]
MALSNNQKEQELTKLNKEMAEKRKKLKSDIHKADYDKSNLVKFFDLFLLANSKVNIGSSEYIPHYVEQILLSIAWMNGSTKEDLLTLYQSLPESCFNLDKSGIKDSGIKDPTKQTAWMQEKYLESSYTTLVSDVMKLTATDRAKYFLAHPDDLTFMSYGRPMLDPQALPTIGFQQVDFVHPVSKTPERMPDCMEMAILNKMLNDLAGGPGNTFNVATLKENLKEMGYQMHIGLDKFLEKYPNPSQVNEIAAHKMWAELVSGLPGVKYNPIHPTFEIVPTVGNALAVFGALLFNSKLTPLPGDFIDYEKLDRDRAKKMDMICKVLSRKDREIGWQLRGKDGRGVDDKELNDESKNETNLVLEFTVNRQSKYDWVINSGHSQVNPKLSSKNDFRTGVGKEMAELILKDKGKLFKEGSGRLLSWLITSDLSNDKEIISKLKSANATTIAPTHYSDFINGIPLESVDNKLFVIGEFAETASAEEGNVSKVDKLKSKIPQDLAPQRRLYATLADHYYYHKIKSGAIESKTDDPKYKDKKPLFTPITLPKSDLRIKVLGSKYVWEEGGLVLGDTIKNPNGSDKKMNFKDAVTYCLSLNKTPLPTTQAEFERFASDKANKPPFNFCYLPTREEYEMFSKKMNGNGSYKGNYLPHFLANLYERWFWSSSVRNAFEAYVFDGNNGFVSNFKRNISNSVRCACAVTWRGN